MELELTLNACVSDRPGPTHFSNLAKALVQQKTPYALGMRLSIHVYALWQRGLLVRDTLDAMVGYKIRGLRWARWLFALGSVALAALIVAIVWRV